MKRNNENDNAAASNYKNSSSGNLRVLIERHCLAPLTLNDNNDGDCDRDGERNCHIVRRTYGYAKLPRQQLKLSVLKLDGSLFDVEIRSNATVAELKQAVEGLFASPPEEEGRDQGRISWSHVWGHFCLCYQGHKLIHDKDYVRDFGIKDGDQLQFVRHMSINCLPHESESRSQIIAYKQYSFCWSKTLLGSSVHEDHDPTPAMSSYLDEEESHTSEFKLSKFIKGCLLCKRPSSGPRGGSEGTNCSSRFAFQSLGGRTRVVEFPG